MSLDGSAATETHSYLRKLDEVDYWRQRAGWYDDDTIADDDVTYNNRLDVRITNTLKNLGLTQEIFAGIVGVLIVALFIRVATGGPSRGGGKNDRSSKRQSSFRGRGRSRTREWNDDVMDTGFDDYIAMEEERSIKSSRSKRSKRSSKSKRSRSKSKRSSTRSLKSSRSSRSKRSRSKSRRSSSKSRRSSSRSRRSSSKSRKSSKSKKSSPREMLV